MFRLKDQAWFSPTLQLLYNSLYAVLRRKLKRLSFMAVVQACPVALMPVLTPALTVYIAYLFLTVPLKTVLEILLEQCATSQRAK